MVAVGAAANSLDVEMFEFEVSSRFKTATDVPPEIAKAFAADPIAYPYRSVHNWEEHCTECAFPDCYKSCDLFEPRADGNCRRFEQGVVPIEGLTSGGSEVVEITFKRWASLYAAGAATLLPMPMAERLETGTRRQADLFRRLPDAGLLVNGRPAPWVRVARRMRRRSVERATSTDAEAPEAEAFIAALFVPGETEFDATLTISSDAAMAGRPFQKRLLLDPGYHRIEVPMAEIAEVIGANTANFVSLIPNTEGRSTFRIYLGFIGFVGTGQPRPTPPLAQTPNKSSKAVKIMVWDLDNTLWNGVLVEDGVDRLSLRPGVADIVKALDARGIVNSVASKNDAAPALAAIAHFGLAEYFVFPQISWNPKSQALRQIIADFNIGEDTVAFIDDQPFERSEVQSALPEVRTYDAAEAQTLLARPEFNPEVSSESASRRMHYVNEGARQALKAALDGDEYDVFLRECDLRMEILQGEGQNVDRIYELTQRTNQMNFSGTRYTRDDIVRILGDSTLDAFSLRPTHA
jgi:FkbH-like protein